MSDYLKIVSVVDYYIGDSVKLFDTNGYLCKMHITDGALIVTGLNDVLDNLNGSCLEVGDEIEFIGSVKMCSRFGVTSRVRVTLYEKI